MKSILFNSLLVLCIFCVNCTNARISTKGSANQIVNKSAKSDDKIGQYIVELFEDSNGNLWIGTLDYGVAKYDGEKLTYLTEKDGLIGPAVVSIVEDDKGIIWFGTQTGLSRYDGTSFTNYNSSNGLENEVISNLLIDKNGLLWIGTWGGIYQFDGDKFEKFHVPVPEVENPSYLTTMDWVTNITEDENGNIYIGRDGYGVSIYDGQNFSHFTKKDGLHSNNIISILLDKKMGLLVNTRVVEMDHPDPAMRKGKGGVQRYNGQAFTEIIHSKYFEESSGYLMYRDRDENLWIGLNGIGVYKYYKDSYEFYDHYDPNISDPPTGFVLALHDSKGNIWIGTNSGLYKVQGTTLINIRQDGPW